MYKLRGYEMRCLDTVPTAKGCINKASDAKGVYKHGTCVSERKHLSVMGVMAIDTSPPKNSQPYDNCVSNICIRISCCPSESAAASPAPSVVKTSPRINRRYRISQCDANFKVKSAVSPARRKGRAYKRRGTS